VALRIVFALVITALLTTPFLKIVGALALFWIAVKLTAGDDEDGSDVRASDRLWIAVRTIAIADAVMSLDNVIAIAAVARGSIPLLVFGLLVSIPLIMAGATLISALLDRIPVLLWAGAALLGWVAGEMLATDPLLVDHFGQDTIEAVRLPAAVLGGAFVVLCGLTLQHRRNAAKAGRP
jgi:YjbE family integral membrane protein